LELFWVHNIFWDLLHSILEEECVPVPKARSWITGVKLDSIHLVAKLQGGLVLWDLC
jgi:hypothetical protein